MSQLDPKALLASLVELYKGMSSYSDTGVVMQTFGKRDEANPHKIAFSTAFVRPNLFKFEFASPHPYPPLSHVITTHICGFDGSEAYSWMKPHDGPSAFRVEENLPMAVAGATGISGGSATRGGRYPSQEIRRNIRIDEPVPADTFLRPQLGR